MLQLTYAGPNAFDLWTKHNAYAGLIAQKKAGYWMVYFNANATRGSVRKFATAQEAIAYVIARRIKKGWRV